MKGQVVLLYLKGSGSETLDGYPTDGRADIKHRIRARKKILYSLDSRPLDKLLSHVGNALGEKKKPQGSNGNSCRGRCLDAKHKGTTASKGNNAKRQRC